MIQDVMNVVTAPFRFIGTAFNGIKNLLGSGAKLAGDTITAPFKIVGNSVTGFAEGARFAPLGAVVGAVGGMVVAASEGRNPFASALGGAALGAVTASVGIGALNAGKEAVMTTVQQGGQIIGDVAEVGHNIMPSAPVTPPSASAANNFQLPRSMG